MTILIALLSIVLVLDALLLILLVLIQLPKKEAGAGLAFGAGATDALFGAGSGNALTKITKYAAATFLTLSLIIAVLQINRHRAEDRGFEKALQQQAGAAPITAPAVAPVTPASNATPFIQLDSAAQTPANPQATLPATNAGAKAPTPQP